MYRHPAQISIRPGQYLSSALIIFRMSLIKGPFSSSILRHGESGLVCIYSEVDPDFSDRCGHCKKLAPTWKQLARHMQNKLNVAEVNCDAHAALCKAQDVPGFPMLVYYANGAKSEYTGGRKFDPLKAFTERASST